MYSEFDDSVEKGKSHPQQYTTVPEEEGDPALSYEIRKTAWGQMRPWTEELIWCALALAFLGALVVVLLHFDNHPLPEWPLGLTVNTLVALLATVCRAMIIVPIEEGLSQLKWNWFATGKRPLNHLYDFDQASRGPWGALRLVPRTRGGFIPFSAIAAIVWATGIATSFVTQSTITYQPELIPVQKANAFVPIARSFPGSLLESGLDSQDVFEGITRGAYQAAFYTVNQSLPQVTPTCSTSHCSWKHVYSLASCASMRNITQYVEVSRLPDDDNGTRAYNASLPDDFGYLHFTDELHVMMNVSSPSSQEHYTGKGIPERKSLVDWGNPDIEKAALAQFFVIYSNASPNIQTRFRAVQLLWHFCVQSYSVEVHDGADETAIIASTVKTDSIHSISDGKYDWDTFTLTDAEGRSSFNITTSPIHLRIDQDFRDAFSGDWTSDADNHAPSRLAYQLGYNLMSGIAPTTSDEEFDTRTWNNLQTYTDRIAEGMTAFLRIADATGFVSGEGGSRETYIFVRWEWLSLLVSQIALTLGFVICIAIHTAFIGVDVVKSSNIAELFALHESAPGETCAIHDLRSGGIKSKVEKLEGTLINTEDGWKLQT